MAKTVKAVTKRTKNDDSPSFFQEIFSNIKIDKVAAPAKEFVAGQLALQDTWDGGRGNSTTTTRLVLVRSLETGSKWGPDAVVVLEDGSLAIVSVSTLRHLPAVFKSATI